MPQENQETGTETGTETTTTTSQPAPPEGYKWGTDESGVDVLVPEHKWDQYINRRQAFKEAARGNVDKVEQRLQSLESKLREEAEAKAKAQFEAQLEEHKKSNNPEAIRQLLEKQYQEQLRKVASENELLKAERVDEKLKSAFRKVEGFIPDLEEDALILYKSRFDVVDGFVKDKSSGSYLLSDAGEKLNAAEHVKVFLKAKPQFIAATHSPGSGATGSKGVNGADEMTLESYNAILEKGGTQGRELAKRLVEGKLKLT